MIVRALPDVRDTSKFAVACRQRLSWDETCDVGAPVWADFGRKADVDEPKFGPKLPARAVWVRMLVRQH